MTLSMSQRALPTGFIAPHACLRMQTARRRGSLWLHEIKYDDFRMVARNEASACGLQPATQRSDPWFPTTLALSR
jgi:hypothetical protein